MPGFIFLFFSDSKDDTDGKQIMNSSSYSACRQQIMNSSSYSACGQQIMNAGGTGNAYRRQIIWVSEQVSGKSKDVIGQVLIKVMHIRLNNIPTSIIFLYHW
ncbi:hypothetical protein EO92_12680 [Methanosarcina sp. 2.H.A.1B.4]|nr:hypothetical protein EO92_12680 [Methanosarcina sp. 2.H.A.1B.4]